ncbi:5-hydroxytryptamine receptor 1B-like [Oculina patagonica]
MANFTADENFLIKLTETLNASPAGTVEVFSALINLNIFLSFTASLGNALILIALHKVSSIHPPTKLLFRCLALTDLCVGLLVQPLYATLMLSLLSKMNVNTLYYVFKAYGASGLILSGVSFLTSTAISVDRLHALLLGLRYRQVVTLKRVCAAITCFWLFGASLGWIWVWRLDIALKETFVVIILSLVTSIFCYTRIHLKLRDHQAQVQNNVPQGQPNGEGIPLNIARYRKSVSSILWVQLALVACYVPFCIAAATVPPGNCRGMVCYRDSCLPKLISKPAKPNPVLLEDPRSETSVLLDYIMTRKVNINFLLQEDFPQTSASSSTSTKQCPPRIARYKMSVFSIMFTWVQLALVVCYVPFCISAATVPPRKSVVAWFATENLSETLVYLNSSLSPLLYCWKIREERQAVKDMIRQLYCSFTYRSCIRTKFEKTYA